MKKTMFIHSILGDDKDDDVPLDDDEDDESPVTKTGKLILQLCTLFKHFNAQG